MKILVIGGYGNFGKRLVVNLLTHHKHHLIIAGRSKAKAEAFKIKLFDEDFVDQFNKPVDAQRLGLLEIDVLKDNLESRFKEISVDIVVNASGPYQLQREADKNYAVARACMEAGCHYIDFADDRDFVSSFADSLVQQAKEKGVCLVSGASTVPGLTSAVIDEFAPEFSTIEHLNYGISPGNRTERGQATIGSILSYTGKAFSTLINGSMKSIYGWQDLRRYDFGAPIGKRWMSNCDIPDLDLLPQKYPDLKTIRFQAGLEISLLHVGLWFLSGYSRIGWVSDWSKYTRILTKMSEWFIHWGSDCGGMFVELTGKDKTGQQKKVLWQLVAEDGVGPNVPTISAELVINKIAKGELSTGAQACLGLFTLDDFFKISERWGIYQKRKI